MEDSNQTPFLHESVNAAVADDVQAPGLPLPDAEVTVDNVMMRIVDGFNGITIDYSYDEVPSLLFHCTGICPFEGPNMHHLFSDVFNDDQNFANDQFIEPVSPPDLSWLFRQPAPRRNPNPPCTLTGVKIIICAALLSTLWSIVCLTMVFGADKIGTLQISHGFSLILQPNRFFVETIIVEQPSGNEVGPILYGFDDQPSLNVISSWSETHYASLEAHFHEEWMYFLSKGSAVNISYSVPSSSRLLLTITKGIDNYGEWLYDDESSPLSWNIILGNGLIQQNILQSGRYHIVVENLNSVTEEVELNISARIFSYDTSDAYYMCMLAQDRCVFPLLFLKANRAVLTTRLKQGTFGGKWYVKLAYEPRWSTYFGGIVVINGMMLAGLLSWNKYGERVDHLNLLQDVFLNT